MDDSTARGVMAAASAVVVPSIYEGFGLPALEAMAVGVPVVAARRSSLPEVCGDAAYLVEPDPAGLAEGLLAALDGGADVEAMVARGRHRAERFTWEASVSAHAAVRRVLLAHVPLEGARADGHGLMPDEGTSRRAEARVVRWPGRSWLGGGGRTTSGAYVAA